MGASGLADGDFITAIGGRPKASAAKQVQYLRQLQLGKGFSIGIQRKRTLLWRSFVPRR